MDERQFTVTINSSRTLPVKAGVPLRDALLPHKILIPTACGGRGFCGYCKVTVTSGAGPLTPAEQRLLSAGEVAAGVRLSCQVKVAADLDIRIPEAVLNACEFRCTVDRIRDLNYDTKEVRVRLDDPNDIRFDAGQYIQLLVPGQPASSPPLYRSFSISNPPSQVDAVDLLVRLTPKGVCTPYIFERLREGDPLTLSGPYGEFVLRDTGREMIWLSGGSGISPFRSMARHMAERGIARKTTCFFGAIERRDLICVDEFREVERALPSFRFIPALSKPGAGDAWDGETGLITDVADRHVPQDADADIYLCGSGGMIASALKVLRKKNIPDTRIFFDRFT